MYLYLMNYVLMKCKGFPLRTYISLAAETLSTAHVTEGTVVTLTLPVTPGSVLPLAASCSDTVTNAIRTYIQALGSSWHIRSGKSVTDTSIC